MKVNVLITGGEGYIGSALCHTLVTNDYNCEVVDLQLFGQGNLPQNVPSHRMDYRDLTSKILKKFQIIIHLAGQSSVPMSVRDPFETWKNNVSGFVDLLQRLTTQRLIYASSSSVYSGCRGELAIEENITTNFVNIYDLSKFNNDACAKLLYPNSVGLRFGTVCGTSNNLRTDVMINRMVLTALRDRIVNIANPQVYRPILGLNDLCHAVLTLLKYPQIKGAINLASFNRTVQEIGQSIAQRMNVPIQILPDSPTYDFTMSCEKFIKETQFSFQQTTETITDDLIEFYKKRGLHEHLRP